MKTHRPSAAELSRNDIHALFAEKQADSDRFRWGKIGHALTVLHPDGDKLLMVRHVSSSHDNVEAGMLGPVAETVSAVTRPGNDLWVPESRLQVAARSLREEIGVDADTLGLEQPSGVSPESYSYTMSWPMQRTDLPQSILNTFAICTHFRATNPDVIDDAVFDEQEVDGVSWVEFDKVLGNLAFEQSMYRPGVPEWFTQAHPRAIATKDATFAPLKVGELPEVVADFRFDKPECVKKLGLQPRNTPRQ